MIPTKIPPKAVAIIGATRLMTAGATEDFALAFKAPIAVPINKFAIEELITDVEEEEGEEVKKSTSGSFFVNYESWEQEPKDPY